MRKREQIKDELEQIRKEHRGLLRPADVVAFARRKGTALHGEFEWNNSKAAEEYRLWQARRVIEVHVTIVRENAQPFRAYVSVKADRQMKGGGYRAITDVLSNKARRAEFLQQGLQELTALEAKYQALEELARVFAEVEKAKKRHRAA